MNAPRPKPLRIRLCVLAFGLMALAACAPAGGSPAAEDDADDCGAGSCGSPGQLATQVRLDTDAMLAGMAHARARMGLQEDATP